MMRVHSSRNLVGCVTIALLAIALVVVPASAPAVGAARNEGRLSPRLSLLVKPAVRSSSDRAQARSLGLPASGPGSLLREGNRVLTEVRFSRGVTAGAADLREEGAKVVDVSPRYQVVTAAAKPGELRELSEVPHVAAVTELFAPIVAAEDDGPLSAAVTTPCFGANTSEGDAQLRAAQARAEFGVDGTGVKVGILSDSFDHDLFAPTGAAEDAISGDLPGSGNPCERETPVEVLSDPEKKRDDEGRAMAQIVHDLAPGAELAFATAFKGLPNFAANVESLATAGADVIADDVTYFEEPFFQEGPVGVAVKKVTEAGVSYFSSAGNNNLKNGGRNIASWEAPAYRDANGCPVAIVNFSKALEGEGEPGLNPAHCMDFDPGGGFPDRAFSITVSDGATLVVDVQWAEPWEGVATNLDAFLLGPKGSVVSASLADNVHGSEKPFELVSWENETGEDANVQLVVNRFAGSANPRLKFALLENGSGVTSTEYESSAGGDVVGPTIFGHNGAETAISVGAVPYFSEEAPEVYSSRGPVTHYFGPATGTGTGPASPLGPQVLAKPDIVATDGGANTFFGSCEGGVRRFFGTSASAPHAAAVAALMREAEPAASGEAVEKAMEESARPVGLFPATAIGAGLIDAVGAIEKLGVVAGEPGAEVAEPPAPGPCLPPREPGGGPQTHSVEPLPTPTPPIEPPARTSRPRTFFLQRPAKVVRTVHRRAKVVFLFGSNEPGVSFACRIDGGLFRHCSTRLVRRFPLGWHTVKVAALDSAGNGDKTPASYRFKVKRVR